jgi:hypothetical protein
VKLSEEDLSQLLRSWPEFIEYKEIIASRVYLYFREPTRSMIDEWNQIAPRSETERAVAQGMQLVNKEQFYRLVFGERNADFKWSNEVNLDRMRGTGSSSNVSEYLMIRNAILYRMRRDSNLDKIDESLKDLDEAYIF